MGTYQGAIILMPLDAITWALIALGLYIGILAVKVVIYGAQPYEALPKSDKMIYRYGQLCIGAAVAIVLILTARALTEIVRQVYEVSLMSTEATMPHPQMIPNGTYDGVWGGYNVNFVVDGLSYKAQTKIGIRTPATKCKVYICDSLVTVDIPK